MYDRFLEKPQTSIFLLGPRGTGKSTWLRRVFGDALTYDLSDNAEHLRFTRNPSLLYEEVSRQPAGSWIVIDEVQRVPKLLNEVHRLIEEFDQKFVLSCSSTRKIRRTGVNLLAGRARTRNMFPLTSGELGSDFDLDRVLRYGCLPLAMTGDSPKDYVNSYVQTYLTHEIQAEAQLRNLAGFSRFLEVSARQNAQVTNISNVARDASAHRTTVNGYFQVLVDTLMGNWLPAWKLKRSNKQVKQSKFYFFDCGVVRALTGRAAFEPSPEELGVLLETLVFNELRAYLAYRGLDYPMSYFRNYYGTEVDFLIETPAGYMAIEVKSATRWNRKFNSGFRSVKEALDPIGVKSIGVFNGPRPALVQGIELYPVGVFLEELWSDRLIGKTTSPHQPDVFDPSSPSMVNHESKPRRD